MVMIWGLDGPGALGVMTLGPKGSRSDYIIFMIILIRSWGHHVHYRTEYRSFIFGVWTALGP